jgi:hypothetical protein
MEGRNYRVYRKILYIYEVASLPLVVTLRHCSHGYNIRRKLVSGVLYSQRALLNCYLTVVFSMTLYKPLASCFASTVLLYLGLRNENKLRFKFNHYDLYHRETSTALFMYLKVDIHPLIKLFFMSNNLIHTCSLHYLMTAENKTIRVITE